MRSKLEGKVKEVLDKNGIEYQYEPERWDFERPVSKHKYTPDFKIGDTYYEVKGRLTAADRYKMLLVTEQHRDKRIVMLFDKPDNKLYAGSKTTYAGWCDKNSIEWQSVDQFLKDNYGYEPVRRKLVRSTTPKRRKPSRRAAAKGSKGGGG